MNYCFQEVDNIKEEFDSYFDDEDAEKTAKNGVPLEKYEELRVIRIFNLTKA
jgi:hypothetical protein